MRGNFSGMKLAILAALFAWPASGALAQTSLGGVDLSTPSQPPPFVVPAPAPALPRPSSPRMDYIPTLPDSSNRTPAQTPDPAAGELWAAIGFTADGSYASAWKADSKSEAEAEVAKKCARFGRGGCEISAVSGRECLRACSVAGRTLEALLHRQGLDLSGSADQRSELLQRRPPLTQSLPVPNRGLRGRTVRQAHPSSDD